MKILRRPPTRFVQAGDKFDCPNCGCGFEIEAHDAAEMLGNILRCPECRLILAQVMGYAELFHS
ncbi:MAG TPA: hypothetical protein VMC43_01130 [Candidatus Paceibacterota bacterium]|nr:hypothetical protein [Candidatus Paceibacterota bacterium]